MSVEYIWDRHRAVHRRRCERAVANSLRGREFANIGVRFRKRVDHDRLTWLELAEGYQCKLVWSADC
jgi:hypothetical protein